MNHCIFTGHLLDDPSLGYEPNPSVCTFKLVVHEYKRNKQGQKKRYPTSLTFQVFDSGADAIVKLGKKGMKMTIYASAKNGLTRNLKPTDDIIFRVNSFDFGCLDKD